MTVTGIFSMTDRQFHPTDDGAQGHALVSPVPRFSLAEGEKPRRGGWLLLGVSLAGGDGSIPALRLALLPRSHTGSVVLAYDYP